MYPLNRNPLTPTQTFTNYLLHDRTFSISPPTKTT